MNLGLVAVVVTLDFVLTGETLADLFLGDVDVSFAAYFIGDGGGLLEVTCTGGLSGS